MNTQPWSFGGGMPSNPYLGQQAQAMANVSNRNLQNNVLPSVNSGAVAAGGFGGSRHGIAQGLAIQGQQQTLNDSLSNLYGNAYANDQNLANQFGIASMNNSATLRGQDLNYQLGQAGVGQQRYATDVGAGTAMRGQDLTYGLGQQQNALGYAGLQNSANIAGMQNQTALRGQDQSYSLGMTNAGISQQNADTNTLQANQSYNLGLGNLGLGYGNLSNAQQQTANNLYLGQQANALGYAGLSNQFNIAGLQNTTAQRGQDLTYGANIYGTNANILNNALSNATQRYGQDLNYNLGLGQNANTANGQLMNFYTNNRQLDQSGLRLGADLVNAANQGYLGQGQGLYNLGLTQQNAPWQTINNMNAAVTPYTGYGTTTSTQSGSQLGGALGGALGAAQLYRSVSGGSPAASSNLGLGGYVPTTDYTSGANYNLWG